MGSISKGRGKEGKEGRNGKRGVEGRVGRERPQPDFLATPLALVTLPVLVVKILLNTDELINQENISTNQLIKTNLYSAISRRRIRGAKSELNDGLPA